MTTNRDEATAIIARLDLAPHPEGGWYRETWRAPPAGAVAGDAAAGGISAGDGPAARSAGTAILFLLEAGQRSHWHRVDATEHWLWHAGAPILLALAATDGDTPATIRLSGGILAGDTPQALVPPGWWQAAATDGGWALASCVVVPGFNFAGFELAAADWAPGR